LPKQVVFAVLTKKIPVCLVQTNKKTEADVNKKPKSFGVLQNSRQKRSRFLCSFLTFAFAKPKISKKNDEG